MQQGILLASHDRLRGRRHPTCPNMMERRSRWHAATTSAENEEPSQARSLLLSLTPKRPGLDLCTRATIVTLRVGVA